MLVFLVVHYTHPPQTRRSNTPTDPQPAVRASPKEGDVPPRSRTGEGEQKYPATPDRSLTIQGFRIGARRFRSAAQRTNAEPPFLGKHHVQLGNRGKQIYELDRDANPDADLCNTGDLHGNAHGRPVPVQAFSPVCICWAPWLAPARNYLGLLPAPHCRVFSLWERRGRLGAFITCLPTLHDLGRFAATVLDP